MKIILNHRQMEVLKYFIAAGTPCGVDELAVRFQRSERTIRYDISAIRKELSSYKLSIKNKSKQGFFIPVSQKQSIALLMAEMDCAEYILVEESDEMRTRTLYLYLLTLSKVVRIDEIADYFHVSRSTMVRILSQTIFPHPAIHVKRAGGYALHGDEALLRQYGAILLSQIFQGSYTKDDWYLLLPQQIKQALSLGDIANIAGGIMKVNTRFNVWLSNSAFLQLLSYCIIARLRCCNHCYMPNDGVTQAAFINANLYAYAMDLLQSFQYPDDCTEEEAAWMMKTLYTYGVYTSHAPVAETLALDQVLPQMIAVLQAQSVMQFDYATLYDDLYRHLQHYVQADSAMLIYEENPVMEELKTKYAPYFELAVQCAAQLSVSCAIHLSDSEISYIAIYLYKNCVKENSSKKRVLVVCATGRGLSNLLATRIRNVFPNVEIVAQASPYQLTGATIWKDIDFVISTIPLENCTYPLIKISKILTSEDIQRIHDFLLYGNFVDALPLAADNSASFHSKHDPYDLFDISYENNIKGLAAASTIISKLMLTLLEYTSKLPKNYRMNQDSLLGLIIHMSMAIPRWFAISPHVPTQEMLDADALVQKEHASVYAIMERFFQLVEQALLITISVSERYAFFLYIIQRSDVYEKHTD